MLAIEAVRSGYGTSEVLHSINMHLPAGKITVLIGPNGAGKSTLLKTIMHLIAPTSGKILFEGADISNENTREIIRKGVTYVGQGAGVFPSMTVVENVALGGYMRSGRNWRSQVDEVLDLFPFIRERKAQKAGFLSGGERQMLAIARALVTSPKLLLLDEPSLGLDIGKQQLIISKLKELNAKGFTILLAEQNLIAADVADYAYVLNQGVVKYEGDPSVFKDSRRVTELFFGIGKGS